MSDRSSNSEIQKLENALSPAGPAALAEKLQDIARDLLKFHHIAGHFAKEYTRPDIGSYDDEAESVAAEKGEVHCYYLCPFTLRNINTLLEEEGANDWCDLLRNAYNSLHGFTTLLENTQPEAEFKGFVLHILARELKRIENMLLRIYDAYDTVEKIDISR